VIISVGLFCRTYPLYLILLQAVLDFILIYNYGIVQQKFPVILTLLQMNARWRLSEEKAFHKKILLFLNRCYA
jgi:hypothetical protein